MVKLVDTGDLKSPAERHVGSTPALGTKQQVRSAIAFGLWSRLRDLLASLARLGKFFQDHIKRSKKQSVRNS